MSLPSLLARRLRLPVIGSPMFIVSTPALVIAQCRAGIIGAMPALNVRPQEQLDTVFGQIEAALVAAGPAAAPYAINQIVHPTNARLDADMECCIRHRVPIIITSLNPPDRLVDSVHAYGGLVFHDVINVRHAKRAIDAGVDGLVLVCAGAGGHTGQLSPFALVEEVRRIFDGTIVLSGAMTTGRQILAAQVMGADLIYMGTRFIATEESNATARYKEMIVSAAAADIVCTSSITGVTGNYLRPSIEAVGLDPDNLPPLDRKKFSFGRGGDEAKAWRDVLSAGHGVGSIDKIEPAGTVIATLEREYQEARAAQFSAADA